MLHHSLPDGAVAALDLTEHTRINATFCDCRKDGLRHDIGYARMGGMAFDNNGAPRRQSGRSVATRS